MTAFFTGGVWFGVVAHPPARGMTIVQLWGPSFKEVAAKALAAIEVNSHCEPTR